MTMILKRTEPDANMHDSEPEAQNIRPSREESLKAARELIDQPVFITATATHTFRYEGDRLVDIFVDQMQVEVIDSPAIIVGTVSNVVYFRTVNETGEEQRFGAWVEDFSAELVTEQNSDDSIQP